MPSRNTDSASVALWVIAVEIGVRIDDAARIVGQFGGVVRRLLDAVAGAKCAMSVMSPCGLRATWRALASRCSWRRGSRRRRRATVRCRRRRGGSAPRRMAGRTAARAPAAPATTTRRRCPRSRRRRIPPRLGRSPSNSTGGTNTFPSLFTDPTIRPSRKARANTDSTGPERSGVVEVVGQLGRKDGRGGRGTVATGSAMGLVLTALYQNTFPVLRARSPWALDGGAALSGRSRPPCGRSAAEHQSPVGDAASAQ